MYDPRWLHAMERLCSDLIANILSRLPVQSLAQAKYVCKNWISMIVCYPLFAKMQLLTSHDRNNPCLLINCLLDVHRVKVSSLFLMDHEQPHYHHPGTHPHQMITLCPDFQLPGGCLLTILGSCDGILCLGLGGVGLPFYLCNPILGEYLELPSYPERYSRPARPICFLRRGKSFFSGFGCDPVTGNYKVVTMFYDPININNNENANDEMNGYLRCEVCTVSIGCGGSEVSSWKYVGIVPCRLGHRSQGLLLNGRLHWCIKGNEDGSNDILSFDIHDEKFHILPGPDKHHYFSIHVLGGRLAYFKSAPPPFDIWVMMEYGNRESWAKEYVIMGRAANQLNTFLSRPSLLCFWNDSEILIERCSNDLVSYDTRSGTIQEVNICGPTCNVSRQVKFCDAGNYRGKCCPFISIRSSIPYTSSLISFKGVQGKGVKHTRNTAHTMDWSTMRHGNDEVIERSEGAVSRGCFEFFRVPLPCRF